MINLIKSDRTMQAAKMCKKLLPHSSPLVVVIICFFEEHEILQNGDIIICKDHAWPRR